MHNDTTHSVESTLNNATSQLPGSSPQGVTHGAQVPGNGTQDSTAPTVNRFPYSDAYNNTFAKMGVRQDG